MIDKKILAHLCCDKVANDQAIKLLLWELADIIAGGVHGISREDARSVAWLDMAGAVERCNTTGDAGEIFNYFYRAGLCAAWRAAKKQAKQPQPSEAATGQGGYAASSNSVHRVRAREPLCLARRAAESLEPLQHIDRRLLRLRLVMRRYDPAEAEYVRIEMMVRTLQALRRDVAGEYLAMRTKTFRFTESRAFGVSPSQSRVGKAEARGGG